MHVLFVLSCIILVLCTLPSDIRFTRDQQRRFTFVAGAYSIRPCVVATHHDTKTPKKLTYRATAAAITSIRMTDEYLRDPPTFIEAEIQGNFLMKNGRYDEALEGTSL